MQIKSYSLLKRSVFLITLSLSLYSCGVWTNFTTYFNLYYDATDLFSQAEDDINKSKTDMFSVEEPAVSPATSALLVKVEEKCSQILQFHAQSSYVDNSLFMIGKCFYYMGNYRKALRKFEELIATQPKSSLILETRLWIGKSQMKLKDFDNSLTTLKDTREEAIKQGEREIAQNCFIEEIRYQVFKKDYSASINLAKSFLTVSKNDVLNAAVAFEIGKLYSTLNDNDNAIAYFKKVTDYSPTYDLRFNSLMQQGKALRGIGQNDKALLIFNQLSREQKYADVLDSIDYERGVTYLKMDKLDRAVEMFVYVDTTFPKLPSAGKSAYELGKIFLNNYQNFDSAAYYFNKVFSSTAPLEFVNMARNSADQLRKYEVLYNVVQFNSKQLSYALDSTAFIKDSIAYYKMLEKKLKQARLDSLKNKDERIVRKTDRQNLNNNQQQTTQTGQQPGTQTTQTGQQPGTQTTQTEQQSGTQTTQTGQQPGTQTTQTGQQSGTQTAQTGQQSGTQTTQTDQSQQAVQQQTGQLQSGQQLQPGTQQQLAQQPASSQQLLQWQQLKSESKPPVRPKLPIDTLTNELVKSEYDLGNLLFTEFNAPDSAFKYYSDIMTNYPATSYQGRVEFAMGDYYNAINDTIKADSMYNVVYNKYKTENIVNAAALKLNKPLINLDYDTAKTLYIEAESLMNKSRYDSSITSMYKIYLTNPKSSFASKALYAVGWMLENKNMNDSAAVIYDTLTKAYPRSVYASEVLPKLNFYKSEIVRIKKARQDSLFALAHPELVSTDSLKKKKSGGLAAINSTGNTPDTNLKDNQTQNNAKDEKNTIIQNVIANPDTLIRNRGRGLRRPDR
jgi:tetratricopeptide (TPR) repeat protein